MFTSEKKKTKTENGRIFRKGISTENGNDDMNAYCNKITKINVI